MNVAQLIDHTLLKPEASRADIEQLCVEARQYGLGAVCVQPSYVRFATSLLQGAPVKVCSVAGFPFGANLATTKAIEARSAIGDGACEVDMVLNIGALKSGDFDAVLRDLKAVADVCRQGNALSKVILETHLLTEAEKIRACGFAAEAGLNFVKTSTGFTGGGATVEDIALMSRVVKPKGLGVKASGGIRSLADLQKMVAAGATRIGTSAGVKIMRELAGQQPAAAAGSY
jgi:deoxyribose-phosphate aldolase